MCLAITQVNSHCHQPLNLWKILAISLLHLSVASGSNSPVSKALRQLNYIPISMQPRENPKKLKFVYQMALLSAPIADLFLKIKFANMLLGFNPMRLFDHLLE